MRLLEDRGKSAKENLVLELTTPSSNPPSTGKNTEQMLCFSTTPQFFPNDGTN